MADSSIDLELYFERECVSALLWSPPTSDGSFIAKCSAVSTSWLLTLSLTMFVCARRGLRAGEDLWSYWQTNVRLFYLSPPWLTGSRPHDCAPPPRGMPKLHPSRIRKVTHFFTVYLVMLTIELMIQALLSSWMSIDVRTESWRSLSFCWVESRFSSKVSWPGVSCCQI